MAIDIKFCQQLPYWKSGFSTTGMDVLEFLELYGIGVNVCNSSRLGGRWFCVELVGAMGSDFPLSVQSDSLRECARLLHKLLTLSNVIANNTLVSTTDIGSYSRFADELERRYASEFPSN